MYALRNNVISGFSLLNVKNNNSDGETDVSWWFLNDRRTADPIRLSLAG